MVMGDTWHEEAVDIVTDDSPSYIVCYVIDCTKENVYEVFAESEHNYKNAKDRYDSLIKNKEIYSANLTRVVETSEWYPLGNEEEEYGS